MHYMQFCGVPAIDGAQITQIILFRDEHCSSQHGTEAKVQQIAIAVIGSTELATMVQQTAKR